MKDSSLITSEINQLSAKERFRIRQRYALHRRYEAAVALYADTDASIRSIAAECGESEHALRAYLNKYWRELMLRRYGIETAGKDPNELSIYAPDGRNRIAQEKYKDAVQACDSIQYIDLNVSQVARKYNLNATALANFMRVHYPDVLKRREDFRIKLGINDRIQRGVRTSCMEQYAAAVELYRTTNMGVREIAEKCNVSEGGLLQHLRFYHQKLLKEKREIRQKAGQAGKKKRGELLGNGRKYEPLPATVQKYAEALAMFRDTALTMKEIVRRTGVPAEGFRFYLHKWHRALVLERSGIVAAEDAEMNIARSRQRMKTVAAKYAEAIESLRQHPRPVSYVAREFGHHPEVFRSYLRKHEPELAAKLGLKPAIRKK